jgi:anthranilate phosphoribosyltransferase
MAEAARDLGATDVLALHGSGLDELAVHGPSTLAWMRAGVVRDAILEPAAHGVGAHPLAALAGGEPADNAAAMKALFAGVAATPPQAAYRDIVSLNAAGALKLARAAVDWPSALSLAREAIASGAAADCLARFLAFR